eukprot:4274984-Alexandrium_andersonii.AAC.1
MGRPARLLARASGVTLTLRRRAASRLPEDAGPQREPADVLVRIGLGRPSWADPQAGPSRRARRGRRRTPPSSAASPEPGELGVIFCFELH